MLTGASNSDLVRQNDESIVENPPLSPPRVTDLLSSFFEAFMLKSRAPGTGHCGLWTGMRPSIHQALALPTNVVPRVPNEFWLFALDIIII